MTPNYIFPTRIHHISIVAGAALWLEKHSMHWENVRNRSSR
jgi:hypothetical protein